MTSRDTKLFMKIYKILSRKHGLKLTSAAAQYLEQLFVNVQDSATLMENLDFIAREYVQQHGSGKGSIDRDVLEQLVLSLSKKRMVLEKVESEVLDMNPSETSQYLAILDTFATPNYEYRSEDKAFLRYFFITSRSAPKDWIATANVKYTQYKARYDILKQRILRNPAFRKPTFSAEQKSYFQITTVRNLQGKPPGRFLLFGMLTEIGDCKVCLEDLDGFIELRFDEHLQQGTGLFTKNCFVLAQGEYGSDGLFHVDVLGMPPPENRHESQYFDLNSAALSNQVDLFGGPIFNLDKYQLLEIEKKSEDVSFVILSDVWLDQPQVFDKLRIMFKGYSEVIIPTLFVFIGNFQSTSFVQNSSHTKAYKDSFDQLANLISEFPEIAKKSHFVFVPGFNDPWADSTLPRPPLPSLFTRKLSTKLRNVHFAGNPCRIKYCTQEIVIFREDLMNLMRRNQVLPIAKEQDLSLERHMVSTILDQSYLLPVPLEIKPRLWAHDGALRMYPQPDLLVLADRYDSFQHEYEGCQVVNPGPFLNSEFQFISYQPSTKECETSKIV